MLVSLPLSRQAADTYIALTHRCDYDDLTHRTYEYWTVLHNIRSQPECATATSVEECDGYEQAPPYTTFLKTLFSHTLAQASCEGMAARDMRNFAGDIGYQTFYQGIYLVVVAIITGFLKLIGACLAG